MFNAQDFKRLKPQDASRTQDSSRLPASRSRRSKQVTQDLKSPDFKLQDAFHIRPQDASRSRLKTLQTFSRPQNSRRVRLIKTSRRASSRSGLQASRFDSETQYRDPQASSRPQDIKSLNLSLEISSSLKTHNPKIRLNI
jgi:hypothetical protein